MPARYLHMSRKAVKLEARGMEFKTRNDLRMESFRKPKKCAVALLIKGTFSSLAIFFSAGLFMPAHAETFYWVLYEFVGPTPSVVCDQYVPVRSGRYPPWDIRALRVDNARYNCAWMSNNGEDVYSVDGAAGRHGDTCPADRVLNESTGICDSIAVGKGAPPTLACAGDPINIINGNLYEADVDFESGNSPLSFTRSYNSLDGLWRSSYSTRLNISSATVTLISSDGQESPYIVTNTTISSEFPNLGKLSKLASGWTYTSIANEIFTFDVSGRLVQKVLSPGQVLQLTYSGNTVTVTDQRGQSLSYTEDAQHQPLTLNAPGVNIQYNYNTAGRFVQLSRTKNGHTDQRQFHYEDARNSALLTGITDERGVRYTTWTYDAQGRTVSSQHAGGAELTQVAYNADGTRKVTNELGKSTLYRFVDSGGVKRVSAIEGEPSANCPASNSTFTYNYRGQVLTQTDAKGFVTTHTYNDRGLETTRTEATGTPQARTTTTTWHATFNLPLTVTGAGQKKSYTYDAEGRLTGQTQINL